MIAPRTCVIMLLGFVPIACSSLVQTASLNQFCDGQDGMLCTEETQSPALLATRHSVVTRNSDYIEDHHGEESMSQSSTDLQEEAQLEAANQEGGVGTVKATFYLKELHRDCKFKLTEASVNNANDREWYTSVYGRNMKSLNGDFKDVPISPEGAGPYGDGFMFTSELKSKSTWMKADADAVSTTVRWKVMCVVGKRGFKTVKTTYGFFTSTTSQWGSNNLLTGGLKRPDASIQKFGVDGSQAEVRRKIPDFQSPGPFNVHVKLADEQLLVLISTEDKLIDTIITGALSGIFEGHKWLWGKFIPGAGFVIKLATDEPQIGDMPKVDKPYRPRP